LSLLDWQSVQQKTSKLTSEELMDILEKEDTKKEADPEIKWGDVEKFIQKFEIIDGETLVWGAIIYMKYKKSLPKRRKPLKYRTFISRFNLYYDKKVKPEGYHFLLDAEPFDLSEESVWEARADRIRHLEKINKEKVKKKQ